MDRPIKITNASGASEMFNILASLKHRNFKSVAELKKFIRSRIKEMVLNEFEKSLEGLSNKKIKKNLKIFKQGGEYQKMVTAHMKIFQPSDFIQLYTNYKELHELTDQKYNIDNELEELLSEKQSLQINRDQFKKVTNELKSIEDKLSEMRVEAMKRMASLSSSFKESGSLSSMTPILISFFKEEIPILEKFSALTKLKNNVIDTFSKETHDEISSMEEWAGFFKIEITFSIGSILMLDERLTCLQVEGLPTNDEIKILKEHYFNLVNDCRTQTVETCIKLNDLLADKDKYQNLRQKLNEVPVNQDIYGENGTTSITSPEKLKKSQKIVEAQKEQGYANKRVKLRKIDKELISTINELAKIKNESATSVMIFISSINKNSYSVADTNSIVTAFYKDDAPRQERLLALLKRQNEMIDSLSGENYSDFDHANKWIKSEIEPAVSIISMLDNHSITMQNAPLPVNEEISILKQGYLELLKASRTLAVEFCIKLNELLGDGDKYYNLRKELTAIPVKFSPPSKINNLISDLMGSSEPNILNQLVQKHDENSSVLIENAKKFLAHVKMRRIDILLLI